MTLEHWYYVTLQPKLDFELEKYLFFKWVRILQKIDWYHYQTSNAAPMVRGRSFMTSAFFLAILDPPPSPLRQQMSDFYGPPLPPVSMCQIFRTPPLTK